MHIFMESGGFHKTIREQKAGKKGGVFSICSINPSVLATAMRWGRNASPFLLIESTCNQVNQYGGYSGLTPLAFTEYIKEMAEKNAFPLERVFLGGDHLGPNPWKQESSSSAMQKAEILIRDCVEVGYRKIHLDASMACADDAVLTKEQIAERTVRLCQQAELAACTHKKDQLPLYVIGTDVPAPGGLSSQDQEAVHFSSVQEIKETIHVFQDAFERHGLQHAWERTIAVVVSCGVEFGDREIHFYQREKNEDLKHYIESVPGLVFEAHSTDYQPRNLLRQMVEDHFAILKVGPVLTFAYREALFNLVSIEEEIAGLYHLEPSDLKEILMKEMMADPSHWNRHYQGSRHEIEYSLKYSFNDRVRYYWGNPTVRNAVEALLHNLRTVRIPLALISQFFPRSFALVRDDQMDPNPDTLLQAAITHVLDDYRFACDPNSSMIPDPPGYHQG